MSNKESPIPHASEHSSGPARPPEVMLSIVGATRAFEGVRALDSVSFDVRRGIIKSLIGPNGAGKTTLLNVINGFLRPERGHIYFQGHDLIGMKPDRIALLGLSRTFQLVRLFSVNAATVLDNVMLGAHRSLLPTVSGSLFLRSRTARQERTVREKAMDMLRFVGLEHAVHAQPGALSFGNQRLVELARSLMADPVLLLLDEPASGLNDAEVESFMGLLSVVKRKGVTILLVEHNMKLVMSISDDVVVLQFGRRLAEGAPAAICADPLVIQAYLGDESVGSGVRK